MTRTRALPMLLLACLGCGADDGALPGREAARTAPAVARQRAPQLEAGSEPRDTLPLRRAFGDSLAFGWISGLWIAGENLLVSDPQTSPHLLLIDRRSGAIRKRFGRHGRGPREFQDPVWAVPVPGDPSQVWVYDFQNKRLALLRPDAPDDGVVEKELPLLAGLSLSSPVWTGDRIVSNGLFPDHTLTVLDRTGRIISSIIADPPYSAREVPHGVGRMLLNRSFLAVHPGLERLALSYQYRSRVDFFTAAGEMYASTTGPRPVTPRYHVADGRHFWDPGSEMAYAGAAAGSRFVYALFCGCRLGQNGQSSLPARIHVFDWEGRFLEELALDRPVIQFTVSAGDSLLYASFQDPYPRVGEWALPARLRRSSRPEERPAGTWFQKPLSTAGSW
ncbi:MAG: hypothetical protein HY703_06700 [Gemmatimonadetes bacterium]|nr:hypothetical protein [Gemmatimonadota bacterium]